LEIYFLLISTWRKIGRDGLNGRVVRLLRRDARRETITTPEQTRGEAIAALYGR
jgi:hypothetical protein